MTQVGAGRPATERSLSDADRRAISERGCIIRGLVGSTIHGLMLEGQDDRDEMAVAIEPPEVALGLVGFDHWVYRNNQRERLEGSRGQMRVNRPELIEAHGWDVKYGMHALRLAYQGREYAESGRLTLPMAEPARSRVFAVRRGELPRDEVPGAVATRRGWTSESTPPEPQPARGADG